MKRFPTATLVSSLISACLLPLAPPARAAEYHAGPDGTAAGDGSAAKPWDLQTALSSPAVKAGDTVWLTAGTYHAGGVTVKFRGSADHPVTVRGAAAAASGWHDRATLDCKPVPGTTAALFQVDGAYVVLRDLEVTNSDPKRQTHDTGSHPGDLPGIALAPPASGTETDRGAPAPVTVTETPDAFTLSNGVLTAKIAKKSGSLFSLIYKDTETLSGNAARPGGYWSHAASGPRVSDAVTIDPRTNGGERGEVSVKAVSDGARLGSGPGGSVAADIEIRYALARGDRGLYTYCAFDHRAEYPPTSVGEARFCAKLNDAVFDWMTVDADRNMKAITAYDWNHGTVMNMKEARRMNSGAYKGRVEHKYDYSAVQFDTLAWGWSSTEKHVGLWFINPTIEYLSGGPTKVELSAHRDATFGSDPDAPAPPCLLNYWRGSHYGGSSCVIDKGEHWNKVIGPFLIYCNAGPTPEAMWKDALARSRRESTAWPYDWVSGVDYPHRAERGTVAGQVVLEDPQAPDGRMSHLLVGLTAPDYTAPSERGGRQTVVDWQLDAKHYQFWVRGDEQGRFTIASVRPGTYTLHAIADGVLGEYARADVVVAPGKAANLSRLTWKPVRHGRQLWDIGIPDRTAREFLHGDHYWQWGLYNQYPQDFPGDVDYVVGRSDYHKGWNYCQCPRDDRPEGTTWSVTFDLPEAPRGKATLRLALAATSARHIDASVNDLPAGSTGPLPDTATVRRDGIRGYWRERDVTFDAALMKAGSNVLKLTIPPGNPMSGVEYDYLRLELQDDRP